VLHHPKAAEKVNSAAEIAPLTIRPRRTAGKILATVTAARPWLETQEQ
jgi:hypothetical protein